VSCVLWCGVSCVSIQVEEAQAAAVRSAKALAAAQEELASLRKAVEARDHEIEALKNKQDRMQLTMQVGP
jgi:predicted  nucleic acid-binding Zn-ribbon protein